MMIPVLIGISFVVYFLMDLAPGSPARIILGENADLAAVQELEEEMGLNDPFIVQYVRHMVKMLKGDFGTSWVFGISVAGEIKARLPATLILALFSTILYIIMGLPIGIISAVKKYTWIDYTSLVASLLLTSMPAFWLGLMGILYLALGAGWFPVMGAESLKHFALPSITLAAAMMANLIRMSRSSMLDVTRQDYMRTARAKGAPEGRVIVRHGLRNALLPVITIVGLQFGSLLGGMMVIESVFALPGLGTMIINGVRQKDTPLVVAAVMFVAFLAGFVNLIVDILYAYVDPRIKSQYVKVKKKA